MTCVMKNGDEPHWTIVMAGAAIGEFTVFAAQKGSRKSPA